MWKNKIKQIFILNDEVYFGNMVIHKLDSDGNTLLVKILEVGNWLDKEENFKFV